jgi:hydroxyacylglutathione hydrolase
MDISAMAAFDDNYIWLIRQGGVATVVDPGDDEPVLQRLQETGLQLGAILITHKHGDHCGGVRSLLERFAHIPVYGPAGERVAGMTHPVGEGDRVCLPGGDAGLQVMEVPGHTEGHLAFYHPDVLFCGDTLFSIGCGRVFSGTHAQLADSLQRIAGLPADTRCYCAHEYTLDNIGFARWVEPQNADLLRYEERVRALRAANSPSIPSTLADELACNPFLRTHQPEVLGALEQRAGTRLDSTQARFRVLRDWKDQDYD